MKLVTAILMMATTSALAADPIAEFNKAPSWQAGTMTYGYRDPLPFEAWKKAVPQESQALSLYPNFKIEPRDKEEDGVVTKTMEEQTVFVSRSTFVVNKSVDAINLKKLISIDSLKLIAPSFEQKQISENQLFKVRGTGQPHNLPPNRPAWCSSADSLCLQSRWTMDMATSQLFQLAMAAKGKKNKDPFEETQSEVMMIPQADLSLYTSLTGGKTPTAGIVQSIFYVNQIVRWGKNVVLIQPGTGNTTNVTIYTVVALASEYYDLKFGKLKIKGLMIGTPDGNMFQTCNGGLTAGMAKLSNCAGQAIEKLLKE